MKTQIDIRMEALDRVCGIAWDENPDAKFLLNQIQSTLYEMDQLLDKQTERMHGSDQYPIGGHPDYDFRDIPNMRRC